ncbi:hypothetical protein LTR08_008588 [Meristemomyces frigidus]|nr:hypothetical protein LTR08_008588 [Meristemomyces frigidus]
MPGSNKQAGVRRPTGHVVSTNSIQSFANDVQQPLDISLGIEIEFLLAHCTYPDTSAGYSARDPDKSKQVVRDLLKKPMTAKCAGCGRSHTFKLPTATTSYNASYDQWVVFDDSSVCLSQTERSTLQDNYFDIYAIELQSRVLNRDRPHPTFKSASDPAHEHTISYADEVTAVLGRLAEGITSADGPLGQWTILVNDACGLHVHVGNQRDGFPLGTIKNAISTYVANERAIDALHATSRIGGNELPSEPQHDEQPRYFRNFDGYAYNMPFSALHSEGVYARRRQTAIPPGTADRFPYPNSHCDNPVIKKAALQYSDSALLTLIQHAPDLTALKHLQRLRGHTCTMELQNIYIPPNRREKMTIEFRQHAGTLQAIEILSWVDFVSNVVQHAHNTPQDEYADLCMNTFRHPSHHTLDLLKTIRCSPQTVQHYRHKLGMLSIGDCYANDLAAKEAAKVDRHQPCRSFGTLQDNLIEMIREQNHPQSVQARITQKLVSSAYGQFSDEFLAQLDFTILGGEEARDKLRIGYVNPETYVVDTCMAERRSDSSSDNEAVMRQFGGMSLAGFFVPDLIKVVPSVAITYVVYEEWKAKMTKEGSLEQDETPEQRKQEREYRDKLLKHVK